MSDVIDNIDAGDVLKLQEIDRLALLFAEDRDQNIGPGDFLASGGLDVEHGPLQDPLKAEGGLGFPLLRILGKHGGSAIDELREFAPKPVDIRPHRAKHRAGCGIVEERQKQVLDGHEFVPLPPGLAESVV